MDKEASRQCYGCAYRTEVSGSAHSGCSFDWGQSLLNCASEKKAAPKIPEASEHGIRNGWFQFPVNFDPVWMESKCEAKSDKADKDLTVDPAQSLFKILAMHKFIVQNT